MEASLNKIHHSVAIYLYLLSVGLLFDINRVIDWHVTVTAYSLVLETGGGC